MSTPIAATGAYRTPTQSIAAPMQLGQGLKTRQRHLWAGRTAALDAGIRKIPIPKVPA